MALRKFLYMDQTEGFSAEQGSTDELSLGKITFIGVSGIALDGGANRATNFATPTAASDLTTKSYVDAIASGLDVKQSVRVTTAAALPANTAAGSGVGKTLTENANGALTVDGVAVNNGDRILVKNEVTGSDNGIYVVTDKGSAGTPFVLTRATDADQDAEVTAGLFTFVAEGTVSADTGWVLITDDPITVDTTSLSFSQFSSTVSYTFDQGLSLTGSSVKVELDTGADAQGAGAGGGNSGLEFDANNAAGKLRAAVNPTGGVQRTSSGLSVLLNGTTIATGASGLSVDHSPRMEEVLTADETISVADAVSISATTNNRHVKARADSDAKSRVTHVATSAAASAGNTFNGVAHGKAVSTLSSATRNTPYYLQATGGIGTSLPGSGNRVIQVGIALNATDLFVRIIDYGKKA
jgi:hypothetical protein